MAKLVPGSDDGCGGACSSSVPAAEEEEGGCGSANGRTAGGEMANMEQHLAQNEVAVDNGLEVEITLGAISGQSHSNLAVPVRNKKGKKYKSDTATPQKSKKQVMGVCKRCGYLSSQEVCKACVLLEGLNKSRPKNAIEVGYETQGTNDTVIQSITNGLNKTHLQAD